VVTIVADEKKKPKTRIEHLFYDGLIQNSFPFNWVLYYELKNRGHKDRDSFNSTLLLGYYVSWQSTYTVKGKLEKGGYSYRSRGYIQYDIGLGDDAQKKARDILENEGLLAVKPMPGQAVYYKVNVNDVFKYLEVAKKHYRGQRKKDVIPGEKEATSNDLEINDLNEEKGKGLTHNNHVRAITFNDYKNLYIPETDDPCEAEFYNQAITAIEYFIKKHKQKFPPSKNPATWTKKLKPATWEHQINKMFLIYDEEYERDLEDGMTLDMAIELIDVYFQKDGYYDGCDYSIVHFNDDKVKKILYYDYLYK